MSANVKLPMTLLLSLVFIVLFSGSNVAMGREMSETLPAKIRITDHDGEAVIILYDTPVSRDFISLLPLSMAFRDYAGEEKIADIPRKLKTSGGAVLNDIQGDFAYYAPWGNLAVFYKGFGKANGLYILGRIESGKNWLAALTGNFAARIEIIE